MRHSSGKSEFINGSRLVYPIEKEGRRFFNIMLAMLIFAARRIRFV